MCGIIISTLDIPDNYKFIENRGPDNIGKKTMNGINFIHFLLYLTGERTIQPIIDDNVVYIFNGEIFNYKEINSTAKSDIHSIIYAYKIYGDDFVKYLNGEFALIIFDFNKNKIYIGSDPFATRPLYYHISSDNITIASYESICKNIKNQQYETINPNTVNVYDLNTRKKIKSYQSYNFDLEQKKDNYDDFCFALEKSILKRYPEKSIPLICLSSGHDSGVIACCLHKYNKNFKAITINKNENHDIINKRKDILQNKCSVINCIDNKKSKWGQYLIDNCEPFIWDWTYHPKMRNVRANGFTQGSMLGKCEIIDIVNKMNLGINVSYSGIGADEVMAFNSFYSQGYGNVDYFPDDMSTVFPWPNFYNGSMQNYIKGDEYVGGSFSYETRYPFCDKELVQEFLWLKPELKNNYKGSVYKPALTYYLERENFPFQLKKYGFNV